MKYGINIDTKDSEMSGNMSDCSDDSFEIVSAESIKEGSVITSMYKPLVLFEEMFDVYPVDTDIVAKVSFVRGYEKCTEDRVLLLPVAWESTDQSLCTVELKGMYVKFDVKDLPKTSADKFYQLCYSSKDKTVMGVSAPFSFREVHEDELMEFQKEQNKEFWTFRSRFAVLANTYWNSLVENKKTVDVEESSATSAVPVKNLEDAATSTEPTEIEQNIVCRATNTRDRNEAIEMVSRRLTYDKYKRNVEQELEEQKGIWKQTYEDRKEQLEHEYEERKETMDRVYEDRKEELELDYEERKETMEREIEEHKEKCRTEFSVARDNVHEEYEKKLRDVQDTMKEAEQKIQRRYNQRTEKLRVDYEMVLEECDRKNEDLARQLEESKKQIKERKLREAELELQLQRLTRLEAENAMLKGELACTKEFVEYMINQKDERLKRMSIEDQQAHVYVYEVQKSEYKKRKPVVHMVKTVENVCQAGTSTEHIASEQRAQSGENVPSDQTLKDKLSNIRNDLEFHQVKVGYKNDEHRREHVLLLRRLKTWFENEALDGYEEIRNDLRTQYFHMERINRHLTSDNSHLTQRYRDLEAMYHDLRKELVYLECKLANKASEKVLLVKEVDNARERLAYLTLEGRDSRMADKMKNCVMESLTREKTELENRLTLIQDELAKQTKLYRDHVQSSFEKEQEYAAQLVNMAYQSQKLTEAQEVVKSDYESRLKNGAKEYAKLTLKYNKMMKLSDHTYAAPRSHTQMPKSNEA